MFATMLFWSTAVLALTLKMPPPPPWSAVFPTRVLLLIASVPVDWNNPPFRMPPAKPLEPLLFPAEGAVRDGQGAIVTDSTAPVLARDIPAKGAIDDRQRATVADGAAYFCTILADGGIDDRQGAAGAVVDASAVAEGAMAASDSIPGDDAVDDRQGAEAVVDAATVFLSSAIADGHLGKRDLDFGFGANDDDLAVDASAINNRCLRTGTDNP